MSLVWYLALASVLPLVCLAVMAWLTRWATEIEWEGDDVSCCGRGTPDAVGECSRCHRRWGL